MNNEKSIENIKKILKRLNVFFKKESDISDKKILAELERNLIKTECKLEIFSDYCRKKFEDY